MIVAVVGDIVKVHIHTKAPGLVLQHGLSWGSLHDIKIDNMAEQHQHRVVGAQTEKHGLAVLSVAAGAVLPASCISSVQLRSSAGGRA